MLGILAADRRQIKEKEQSFWRREEWDVNKKEKKTEKIRQRRKIRKGKKFGRTAADTKKQQKEKQRIMILKKNRQISRKTWKYKIKKIKEKVG